MASRRCRLVVVGIATLALAGCEPPSVWAPDADTRQGERINHLWRWEVLAAEVIGTIVLSLIAYVFIRYRARSTDDPDTIPSQESDRPALELVYIAIPILIVGVLFAVNAFLEHDLTKLPAKAPDVRVEVVGFQWQWQFRYLGEDVTVTGTPEDSPPVLVLPAGKTVRLKLVASDVIHSFWVPEFLEKRDLIPGVDNEIQVTTEDVGRFVGRCAEFCGLDHWRMRFTVRIVPPDEYRQWLAAQRGRASG